MKPGIIHVQSNLPVHQSFSNPAVKIRKSASNADMLPNATTMAHTTNIVNAGRDLYRQAPSRVLSLSAELRRTKRNSSQDSLVGKSFIIHNCSLSSPTRADNDQLDSSNSRETPTTTLAECPYRNDSSSIRDDNRSKIWESSAYNDRASLSLRETSYRNRSSSTYAARNAPESNFTIHSGALPSSTDTEDYQDYSCSNEAQASTGSEPSYHDGPFSSSRTRTAPGNNLIINNYTINYGSLPTATVTNDDHLENSDDNGRWASTHGGNCPAPVSRTQTIPGNGLTIYNNNTINGSPFPSPTGADDDYRYFEASRGNGTVISTLGESSYRNGSCSLSRTRHAPQRNFTIRSRPPSAPSATSGNHLERLCNNASPSTPEEISNRNGPSSTTCTRSVSNLAAPAEPSGPRSSDAELEAALIEFDNRQREREPIGNAEELEAALVNWDNLDVLYTQVEDHLEELQEEFNTLGDLYKKVENAAEQQEVGEEIIARQEAVYDMHAVYVSYLPRLHDEIIRRLKRIHELVGNSARG